MSREQTPEARRASLQARALEGLRREDEPLFAVLDAARSPRILKLLQGAKPEYESLYEGPEGEELAEVAPYLVSLPRDSELLERLVLGGWGESWGCFLTSPQPFTETRRHLRKFLLVQDERTGRQLYFRFYDPRVLRAFLPTCTAEQRAGFFGPLGSFLVEGARGELLRFKRSS